MLIKDKEQTQEEFEAMWDALSEKQQFRKINEALDLSAMGRYLSKRSERDATKPNFGKGYYCGWKDRGKYMVWMWRVQRNADMKAKYNEEAFPYMIGYLAREYHLSKRQIRRIVRGK